MIKNLLIILALASTVIPSIASSFRFPELNFCPLGGPPGWFNRMAGQNDNRYYAPPPPQMFRPAYPQYRPNAWQSPVVQQPATYFSYNPTFK